MRLGIGCFFSMAVCSPRFPYLSLSISIFSLCVELLLMLMQRRLGADARPSQPFPPVRTDEDPIWD